MHIGEYSIYTSTALGLGGFILGTYYKTKETVDQKEYTGLITTSYTIGAISILGALTGLIVWHINTKKHEQALKEKYNYLRIVDFTVDEEYFYDE